MNRPVPKPLSGPPPQHEYEPLLRAGDIARRLSISQAAAYRLMKESLPVVRFGPGTLRVRESDLEKYIDSLVDHHGES